MSIIRVKDLKEAISNYKTNAAKKTFLTKELNALKNHYKEVKKSYQKRKKGTSYGWYLGDKIYMSDLKNSERNIKIVERFKKENF